MTTPADRACIIDRFAREALDADQDLAATALEFLVDTFIEACDNVTTCVLSDSDNGVSLWVDALNCATHLSGDCPAGQLIESDPYATFAYHLRSVDTDWLCETYGLTDDFTHDAPRYTLDLATYRARHAEHCGEG